MNSLFLSKDAFLNSFFVIKNLIWFDYVLMFKLAANVCVCCNATYILLACTAVIV